MARNTQPMSITLPHEMAAMVRAKVESGEYATESEVIRDGLRILQVRDAVVEKWLRDELTKGDDEAGALEIDPPTTEIIARLRAAHRRARGTRPERPTKTARQPESHE